MRPRDRLLLVVTFVLMVFVDLLARAVSPALWLVSFVVTLWAWWMFRQYLLRRRAGGAEPPARCHTHRDN